MNYLLAVEPTATLVHGVARISKPDGGLTIGGHAWVEVTRDGRRFCTDLSTQEIDGAPIPAENYRRWYGVIATTRYTAKEACSRLLETGHSGPWELSTAPRGRM